MSVAQSVDEPLVLADGTKIDPSTGKVIKEKAEWVEVPHPSAAQELVVRARRSVSDLPAPPQQLTGVALVAFYTLFGLSDQDIAIALDARLSVDQVRNIRQLDAYRDFMESAKTSIIDNTADKVRDVFQTHAIGAAHKVIQHAQSDDGVLSFKASQDILDRAGHRPADVVEHRHRMEDALHIVVTKRDGSETLPVVDALFEEVLHDACNS
jgi:hypothetical protein